MRITRLQIPEGVAQGLCPFEMDRLGKVVVLAGRNGAGKSRLLALIDSIESSYMHPQKLTRMREEVERWKKGGPEFERRRREIERSRSRYRSLSQLEKAVKGASWFKLDADERPVVVHFVPKNLPLADPYDFSAREISKRGQDSKNPALKTAVDNLHENAFSAIQLIQNSYWEATHPESGGHQLKDGSVSEYRRLDEILFALLGVKLSRTSEGLATLFGFRLGDSKLSDGQKVLLQLAVALHAQGVGGQFGNAIKRGCKPISGSSIST